MILKIVAVGKLKEKHWQDAVSDYARRLRPYARLEMVQISEARIPERASPAEERIALEEEASAILERLEDHKGPLVALDRQGLALDSLQLSDWLQARALEGGNEMAWVIGGPLGLASSVLERADLVLSFSRMTFPHQMMRAILLEQIYRSFRIMHHEPYHK
jgi:23S rRNA (pseudouridine1915-N3)-methyltransferase